MRRFVIPAIVIAFLGATPAIAQRIYPKPFREYSTKAAYLDFSARPNLCSGQILDNGLICVKDLAKEQKSEKQVAFMSLMFDMDEPFATMITIRTFEVEPNNANIAYKAIIRRFVALTKSDLPLLLAFVKKDGSVSVDTTYGDFPPQFSAEKELLSILEERKGEIRKLMEALSKTR